MNTKTILFVHYGFNWIRGSEKCLYELIEGLDKLQYRAVLWTNNAQLANRVSALGVKVYLEKFNILFGWEAPRLSFSRWTDQTRQALKIINSESVDLIHSNNAAPCQWLALPARWKKIPLVLHLHSPYLFRDRTSLLTYAANKIIAVSSAVTVDYLGDGLPKERMQLVYNGIKISNENSSRDRGIRNSAKSQTIRLVTVGSLIHRKGVDLILHAVKKLRERNYSCELIVVGNGEKEYELKRLSDQLGLEDCVEWLGERNDVDDILKTRADIFVSGAREEAYGLVLAEAGASGLAVVAPKVGGIPEVVDDGITGLLYAKENVDDLVVKLERLINDFQFALNLGRQGQARVQRYFRLESNIAAIQSVYKQQIKTKYTSHPYFIKFVVRPLAKKIYWMLCKRFICKSFYNRKWSFGNE